MPTINIARTQLGKRENPMGSNMGSDIYKYKASTFLSPNFGWPWCVAFWQWVIKQEFGKAFPYGTASVYQLADYARKHNLTTTTPKVGDAALLGSSHITFVDSFTAGGGFVGLGGNQSNQVQRSNYSRSSVTTWVSTDKVGKFLGVNKKVEPKPRYEIVRGEGGQRKVVYTGTFGEVTERAKKLFNKGAASLKIRKKPKKKKA